LLQRGAMDRVSALMRQYAEKIRRGGDQSDLHGVLVRRGDAQGCRRQFTLLHGARVDDGKQRGGVMRSGGRRDGAPQTGDKVGRNQWVAITPARVAAQMESVRQAVGTDVPTFG